MFNKIFDPNNFVFRPLGTLVDVFSFSLMWLMCAATVVLLGPGTTALYDSMARYLRKGEVGGYARFVQTLRSEFKVACPAGLVVVAAGYGMVKLHGALYTSAAAGDRLSFALYIAYWIFLVLICGIAAYLFPMLARFEFKLGGLLSTGVKLAMSHPLTTLLLGLLTVGCILLCVIYWLPGLIVPYIWARLACLLLERVFRPYLDPPSGQ